MKASTFWSVASISAAIYILSSRGDSRKHKRTGRNRKFVVSLIDGRLHLVEEIARGQKLIWEVGDGLSEIKIEFPQGDPCKCGGRLIATRGHDAVCEVSFDDDEVGENTYTISGLPLNLHDKIPEKVEAYFGICHGCKP